MERRKIGRYVPKIGDWFFAYLRKYNTPHRCNPFCLIKKHTDYLSCYDQDDDAFDLKYEDWIFAKN